MSTILKNPLTSLFFFLATTTHSTTALALQDQQQQQQASSPHIRLRSPENECPHAPTTQHLSDPPYENYFYSDCHSSTQVVITTPLETSDLSVISPRIVVAWPAGNSGAVVFLSPGDEGAVNGSLGIRLVSSSSSSEDNGGAGAGGSEEEYLQPIYEPPLENSLSKLPFVGVESLLELNSSAKLSVAILGSIRNVRDFTEGPSILVERIQEAIGYTALPDEEGGGVELSRLWLDNVTTMAISFIPVDDSASGGITLEEDNVVKMEAGRYRFRAKFDYPQLEQLDGSQVLNENAQSLLLEQEGGEDAEKVKSLTFLSYSNKLLAGAWRFLTYFGRDSMIATLLLAPVLSEGQGGAIEAVIGSVLERLNQTSGVVCHEETIGDYATFLSIQQTGMASTAPGCNYVMVDTDYYLMPLLERYFLQSTVGQQRTSDFLNTVSTLDFGNAGLTYGELALINAKTIMTNTAPFASDGGQIKENLIHLRDDIPVGEWRDSNTGIGSGRIPYDINTALVPAALRSISALSAAGWFPDYPEWADLAAQYAQVWEDDTLALFEVVIPSAEAKTLVEDYTNTAGMGFASRSDLIQGDIVFHGLALDGGNDQSIVRVMNTDDCFRLFLLNTTNQAQLTAFVDQTATNIRSPFPVGLLTPVSLVVANPAYGGDPVYAANFTNSAYHGTVVWSWQLSMMAAGLQRQLERCSTSDGTIVPDFCSDEVVYNNVRGAYNDLWDNLEANSEHLSSEVWSWTISPEGEFVFAPLGALAQTESDIRQLWSLTFLAVRRDDRLR